MSRMFSLFNKFMYSWCNKIILEVKGKNGIADADIAQAINYLKVSGNRLSLIVNFGESKLNYKRILL